MAEQVRSAGTKERVLDAAMRVWASGESFTVHAVVAESAVSLGSVYHHFGSFDGVAAALYQRCMAQLLDAIIAAVERTRSARTGIAALVDAYLGFTESERAAARFIHASAYAAFMPAHASAIAASKAPRIARIHAWLQPHVDRGDVVRLPPAMLEMLVIGPLAETARRYLAGDPSIDLATAARILPERIWSAIRKQ